VAEQVQESKRMPTSAEELRGKKEYIAPKAFDVSQGPSDAFLLSWAGAGGYGDPLERDPARVVLDIQRRNVTSAWAYEAYGVVLNIQGQVDLQATETRRTKLRKARIRKAAKRDRQRVDAARARRIAEGLLLADGLIACSKCNREICRATDNYKSHCVMTERPVSATNPYVLDPKIYVDDKMVFRSYACPSCGLLIQIEIARPTDPPLWDIELVV
jgi:N-methylhydantoinase B